MDDKRALTAAEDRQAEQRQTASFLVRLWVEPGGDGEPPALRGLVRNLQSGTEQGIGDPMELGETLLRQLPGALSTHDSMPVAQRASKLGRVP